MANVLPDGGRKRAWKKVRRPRVDLDARGMVATHGKHLPHRGIWHDTEGSDAKGIRDLEGVVHFWHEQGRGYGAHIIIDKDGNSALCANPDQITWHTGGRNTSSVGIELIGFAKFTPSLWLVRPAQLDKLARWMAWLNLEWDIPLRDGPNIGWSGHLDQSKITGGSHWDPGYFFPRAYVLRKAIGYRRDGWL